MQLMPNHKEDIAPVILKHLTVINDPTTSSSELKNALAALDVLVEKEAANLNGDLRHFIARRSYQKALVWLEKTGPVARGICGRGG